MNNYPFTDLRLSAITHQTITNTNMAFRSSSFLVILFLLVVNTPILGQPKIAFSPKNTTISAVQYQPIDLVFKVPKLPVGNPFDLTFGTVFTDDTQKALTVHGFYNGGQEYVLRFCPPHAGVFHYQTFSTLPTLSGLTGTVRVEKNTNPDRHGAVTVAPEAPQKFVYQDGKPYFALAFELDWLFALDINDPKGLPKTGEIIQSVKENGFN